MSEKQVKVVFTPSGRRGSFPLNTPLLHAARVLGVDIDSVSAVVDFAGAVKSSALTVPSPNMR